MAHIAIVIVNWNGKTYTMECLASVKKLKTGTHTVSTIIVDNGSSDGSVDAIHTGFPAVVVIENYANEGYVGGNNRGMKYAIDMEADMVWLLNNDTIVDKDALLPLVDALTLSGSGIAGSKIYFAKGHEYHDKRYKPSELGRVIWYAGGTIDWSNMYASHIGVDDVDRGQFDKQKQTSFITGCSLVVTRGIISAIGYFDERFFLYFEDVDFCLRAKRAGFKLLYVPDSKVWHTNAGSSGGPGSSMHEYYQTRNRLIIGMRYAPLRTRIALLRQAVGYIFSKSSVLRKAVIDFMFGRYGQQEFK